MKHISPFKKETILLKDFVNEVALRDEEVAEALDTDGLKEVITSYIGSNYYDYDDLKDFPYTKVDQFSETDDKEEEVRIVFKRKSDGKHFMLSYGISHYGVGPGIIRLVPELIEVVGKETKKRTWE